MIRDFYDIESLSNVFMLANFKEDTNELEFFYKVDNPDLIIWTDPLLYKSMLGDYADEIKDLDEFESAQKLFGLVPQAKKDTEFARLVDEVVHAVNLNFTGTTVLYCLDDPESIEHMAETFGLSDAKYINNPTNSSHYDPKFRLICDTDAAYDPEKHPFYCGYNSYQYDTTMLAIFFYEAFALDAQGKVHIKCPDAILMRSYNDELFTEEFKSRMFTRLYYAYESVMPKRLSSNRNFSDPKALIRKNMIMSGRHIDVARLNEKMTHVALKRLLGMLGYQIKESDKLASGQDTINNLDELLELFAYNASDVINLKHLADHKLYRSGFDNKSALINSYPEVVYQKKTDEYKPDENNAKVRTDRAVTDATSATITTNILCPYNHLSDYDTVSFMYPSEEQSKKTGIPRVNVLEEAKKFFYDHFPQPECRKQFDVVYNYYKSIEGKNFNSGKNYMIDHGYDPMFDVLPPELEAHVLSQVPAPNLYMVYYNADGTPSSYYVNFSTGGIHGAEYNKALYDYDVRKYNEEQLPKWEEKVALIDKVKAIFPDPWELKVNKGVEIDGVKYKPSDFLMPKATPTTAEYKPYPKKPEAPQLFTVSKQDKWGLNKRYAYTSAGLSNHEDFESYYPNLLRMMDAFFNKGLNYDRYGEVFELKSKYGKMKDDESRSADEREYYSNLRNGVKLILNSASGAGDKDEDSNIRMNNKIISMRIIGQLFTWRIGQAQVFAGAGMPSTNTDGLYSIMESEQNNKILADESADIHVKIEPEILYLISKDSNNRLEIKVVPDENGGLTLGKILGASGGSLSCREGPRPDKSLDHPAILDWALTEYLIYASLNYQGTSLSSHFNEDVGRAIIKAAPKYFDTKAKLLMMFQNIVASSVANYRYTYATDPVTGNKLPLQHYNRVFIMKDGTPNSYYLRYAEAKTISKNVLTTRKKNGLRLQQHDPEAIEMLEAQGISSLTIPSDREATVTKLKLVEPNWYLHICNKDLHMMSDEECQWILDNLDYDKYLELLKNSFENNWYNEMPPEETEQTEVSDASALDQMFAETPAENAAPVKDAAPVENTVTTADSEQADTSSEEIPEDIPMTNPLDEIADTIAAMNKMSVTLNRTIVYKTDIEKAEALMGKYIIPNIDPHSILASVIQILTDTNIDS